MTFVTLPIDALPEDVAIGHILDMQNLIPHDEELEASFKNEIVRVHLRIAEAFAAGLKAGRKESKIAHEEMFVLYSFSEDGRPAMPMSHHRTLEGAIKALPEDMRKNEKENHHGYLKYYSYYGIKSKKLED